MEEGHHARSERQIDSTVDCEEQPHGGDVPHVGLGLERHIGYTHHAQQGDGFTPRLAERTLKMPELKNFNGLDTKARTPG